MTSHTNNRPAAPDTGDEINLSEIVTVIRQYRVLIALVAAATLTLGIAYAFLAKPVYRADAMVQVDDGPSSVNDKLGDLAALFGDKSTADAQIELIRSRKVVDDTVRALHLDITAKPRYLPLIGGWIARRAPTGQLAAPLLGLGSFAWGGEDIRVTQFDVPPDLYGEKFTLIASKDQSFDLKDPGGNVILNGRVGKAASGITQYGAVNLTVTSIVARAGTQFRLTRASTQLTTQDLQKALDIKEKTKQSGVIGVTLEGNDSATIADTVNAIVRLYVQRNVDWKAGQAQQMLTFLSSQLPQLKADLDKAEQRYNAFRTRNHTLDLAQESRLLLESIVDGKTRMLTLQQQREELMQRYTANYPSVVAIDAQLADLLREQDTFNKQVSALPEIEQTAMGLARDVKVNTQLYTNLLDSSQQLRVVKAGQQGDVRVVDFAVVAEKPVKPKKLLVIAGSAVLGLLLGAGVAFARRSFHGGLESTLEIEQVAGVPVYAAISQSERQARLRRASVRNEGGTRVLAVSAPDDVAVESIRSLRTALQLRLANTPNNVVMITGPRPGVGKSFVSVNLAAVLASAGRRVLLIDADMRRGDLHGYLGIARVPGLQEVMAGEEARLAVRRQVLQNLDVLTRGTSIPNSAEMLMSARFGSVLSQLSHEYDVVIVDTPPVLAVTDAALIGQHAGTTLLTMRHGQHSAAELHETMRLLGSAGVSVSGILLCGVPQHATAYGAFSAYQSVAD